MSNFETRLENLEHQVHGNSMVRANNMLDQLGIFFYVLAGVSALFSFLPIFHLIMGVVVLFTKDGLIPGLFLIGFCSAFIVTGLIYSFFLMLAGKSLRARTRPTLITVMAALSCLNMPLGTALGVITLIELNKEEVRSLFKRTL